MDTIFKDAAHLFRVVGLFVVALLVFLVARAVLVPADFGEYGHYRAGAIADNRAQPLVHGGRAACGECHEAVLASAAGGPHARIGCETCHGPSAAHAADPTGGVPPLPDARTICSQCHALRAGRPASFPQVDVAEHAEGMSCKECHTPHQPRLG